jgi:hypothetical protein
VSSPVDDPVPPSVPPSGLPAVSEATRRFLDQETARDRLLVVQTGGYTLFDIQQEIASASPETIEEWVTDGLRWQRYRLPDSVQWRQELEARERARVAIEVSHDLAGAMRWSCIGPTHAELARLRATPAWVRRCAQAGCPNTITVYDVAEVDVPCHIHRAAGQSEGEAA